MSGEQVVIFIHGLGDGPDAWEQQITALPTGFSGLAVNIPGLSAQGTDDEAFSLRRAGENIIDELDRRNLHDAHLCGLSLGAMVALQTVIDHPERVRSLTLAAGQVKPPRFLMAVQNAIMRVLPEKLVAPDGTSKVQVLAVVRAVADTDFSAELPSIAVPTLVLCGSKDRPNLAAARALAAGIPNAQARILQGAGHQANTQTPELVSQALNGFLTQQV